MKTNTIANGVVATVTVTLATQTSGPSVALGLAGAYGALADGSNVPVSGTAGAITVQGWTQPPDTQPPTAPTNLSTVASTTQIALVWTASTDNVGVSGYQVERCQGVGCSSFAQVAALAGTTYNDTGLTAGTSYSYRVRATDAAGNLSSYSNVTSATTTIAAAPAVITSGTTASGTVGSAFSYQIAATNAPTSYGAGGLPAGLTVNSGTGLISGTPTVAGTSTVTLSATNGGGTGNATLTLTIARRHH